MIEKFTSSYLDGTVIQVDQYSHWHHCRCFYDCC